MKKIADSPPLGYISGSSSDSASDVSRGLIYHIGIFGWRKRCLYLMILFVLLMAMVNMTLIVWIIRTQDFGINGLGKLYITTNGIIVEEVSEFLASLQTKQVRSGRPLHFTSRNNISLTSFDQYNNMVGHVTLATNHIILKNKELRIEDHEGRTLLRANDEIFSLHIPNIQVSVHEGVKVPRHLKVSGIRNDDGDFTLQSREMKVKVKAKERLLIGSHGADVIIQSLDDVTLKSKKGKIGLDTGRIRVLNMHQSTIVDDHLSHAYQGVKEVCVCPDGSLFLAPTHKMYQCKVNLKMCT